MAIWIIPDEYIISYSANGDDVDSFSRKVKYCLEQAFIGLNELHTENIALNSAIESVRDENKIPTQIKNVEDGQILVYRESTKKFHNEAKPSVGESKSLILSVGEETLGEYNGSEVIKIDLQSLKDTRAQNTSHLMRLVENLYLALNVMELDPGGYDGLSSNTFFGTAADLDTSRSIGTVTDGKISSGGGAVIVTKPIAFSNNVTGDTIKISKAHLAVKHQNLKDTEIIAEIAINPTAVFVKEEIIGIGTGREQIEQLVNRTSLATQGFVLYFDGVKQTTDFIFDIATGTVTFNAPLDTIVSVDYFYNWGGDNFVAMTATGTYPDRHNPNRATTQFEYAGTRGTVATLRLTLNQKNGYSQNEIVSTGTGKAKAYKLAHQAKESEIQVSPSTVDWSYNEKQNVIIVNARSGENFSVSYWWSGKSFSVDSFACIFDE